MTTATLYQITARFREHQFMPTGLTDFTTDAGTAVDSATVLDPLWSLYNLDLAGDLAIFVRLPPDTDLSRAAFIPQTQFEAATAALTLPLADFVQLSHGLAQPENLILLFSIGRCGTTLANHILNTAPDTTALSEPRAFVTLALARQSLSAARAADLIRASVLFAVRPLQRAMARNLAIKFHSQALYQADLYHHAFPQARLIFMYRDAKGWANSMNGFLQNIGVPRTSDPAGLRFHWRMMTADAPLDDLRAVLDPDAPQTPLTPTLAAGWASNVAHFLALSRRGIPFFPLHYTDLTQDRTASIRALLTWCRLSDAGLVQALATFDRDSQAGTAIGRGGAVTALTDADHALLLDTLARTPQALPWDTRL